MTQLTLLYPCNHKNRNEGRLWFSSFKKHANAS